MFLVSPIMALIVLGLMLGNSISDLFSGSNNCRLNVRSFTFGLALEMALRLIFQHLPSWPKFIHQIRMNFIFFK